MEGSRVIAATSNMASFSGKTQVVLKWKLEDFKFSKNETEPIRSRETNLSDLGFAGAKEVWRLEVIPKEQSPPKTAISLVMETTSPAAKVFACFSIWVMDPAGQWVKLVRPDRDFEEDYMVFTAKTFKEGFSVPHTDLFGATAKYKSVDGSLNLKAEIDFVVQRKEEVVSRYFTRANLDKANGNMAAHLTRLGQLFRGKVDTDFVLVSKDEKELHAHRAILQAHSKVFAAMFTHDTTEKQSGRAKIADVDGETLEVFLEYVYSCSTTRVAQLAEKVLKAADKYDVVDLKTIAEEHLCRGMTLENAAHLIILADKRSLGALNSAVTAFIAANLSQFVDSGGVVKVKEHRAQLATQLVQEATVKKTDALASAASNAKP